MMLSSAALRVLRGEKLLLFYSCRGALPTLVSLRSRGMPVWGAS